MSVTTIQTIIVSVLLIGKDKDSIREIKAETQMKAKWLVRLLLPGLANSGVIPALTLRTSYIIQGVDLIARGYFDGAMYRPYRKVAQEAIKKLKQFEAKAEKALLEPTESEIEQIEKAVAEVLATVGVQVALHGVPEEVIEAFAEALAKGINEQIDYICDVTPERTKAKK